MTDKTISPPQGKLEQLEKSKNKKFKEIKISKKQPELKSGMRRFNRGGKV
tara:strand:+ start:496 stop:645 length:150 start_codon:yes stop_codon:yes gene_type:complete